LFKISFLKNIADKRQVELLVISSRTASRFSTAITAHIVSMRLFVYRLSNILYPWHTSIVVYSLLGDVMKTNEIESCLWQQAQLWRRRFKKNSETRIQIIRSWSR